MKVKIFTGSTIPEITRDVNEFLRRQGARHTGFKVHHVLQSESVDAGDEGYRGEWNLTISVFYVGGE